MKHKHPAHLSMRIVLSCLVFALLVPFSLTFGQQQTDTFQMGLAKTEITPEKAIMLGGYALRSEPFTDVYGPIYTRALVMNDGESRVVLVASNVIATSNIKELQSAIHQATGIPESGILIASTHNHSAPRPGSRSIATDWNDVFLKKVVANVQRAIKNLQPVAIGGGSGTSRIAVNRRKPIESGYSTTTFDENWVSQSFGEGKTDNPVKVREIGGVIRLGTNPEGPIDGEVGLLRIDDASGKPVGLIINYACHGTSLGGRNNTLSPEWMGHMIEYVEREIPGVTAMYVNGAAGDINPRFVGGLEGYQDNLEKTKKLGYEIGREVLRVYQEIPTGRPISSEITIVTRDILLPPNYRELTSENFTETTIAVPTTLVRFDAYTWVTFPGELFHEIGLQIKQSALTPHAFLIGYCNGNVGYLPTQQAFSEGGYEPAHTHFAPVSEQVYLEEVQKLISEVK